GVRLWATYFGGSTQEQVTAYDNLVVDNCDNVFMNFTCNSTTMPTMSACATCYYNPNFNGGLNDMFLTKFSNNGTLTWATYFGGVGSDFRESCTADNMGNYYVAGEWSTTSSAVYPSVDPGGGAFYNSANNGGGDDCYIARFGAMTTPPNYT